MMILKWPHLEERKTMLKMVISTISVVATLIVAILVPSIATIFELVGAFSGSVICFIAPAMFFCKVVPGPTFIKAKWKAHVRLLP